MRGRNILCISIIDCFPNSLVGDPSWMASHLIPLMRRRKATWLERPFEESEVHEMIYGMNGDKVLGLDGLEWHSSKLAEMCLKKTL